MSNTNIFDVKIDPELPAKELKSMIVRSIDGEPVRFIHVHDSHYFLNDFTIAYFRDDLGVHFTHVIRNKLDRENRNMARVYASMKLDHMYKNGDEKIGFLTVENFRDLFRKRFDNVITLNSMDGFVESIGIRDLKHVFISSYLFNHYYDEQIVR